MRPEKEIKLSKEVFNILDQFAACSILERHFSCVEAEKVFSKEIENRATNRMHTGWIILTPSVYTFLNI